MTVRMSLRYEDWGDQLQILFPKLDFSPKDAVRVPVTRILQLVPGDLLCVPFHDKFHNSLPWHFGVAVGDLRIMDLVNGRKPEVAVMEVEDFVGDSKFVYVIPQNNNDRDVQRDYAYKRAFALKAIIDRLPTPAYHLTTFNCRHFATMCCTGRYEPDHVVKETVAQLPSEQTEGHGLCGKAQSVDMCDILYAGINGMIHR
jgi:hypothetical protein